VLAQHISIEGNKESQFGGIMTYPSVSGALTIITRNIAQRQRDGNFGPVIFSKSSWKTSIGESGDAAGAA